MVVVVWTPRDENHRIISMRKANEREQEFYGHTDWIDEDDAPELTDAFFEQADDEYNNSVLIKRGFASKKIVNLDSDIIAIFKTTGENWQAKMNDVLREWVNCHPNLQHNEG